MHRLSAAFLLLCLGTLCPTALRAADDRPDPQQDDAGLHDVQFVGRQRIWAVGDRGVIWHSPDSGSTWRLEPSGTRGRLRSACFLTNTLGWVAGEEYLPGGFSRGVLLATRDGGETWQPLVEQQLPPLRSIRFFDLEVGLAVGAATPTNPTGVYRTQDGGKSWSALPGPRSTGWQSSTFLSPEIGLLGGRSGELMVFVGDQLLPTRLPPLGRKAVRAVHLQNDETAWLVGDGGLVMMSGSGGVVWEDAPTPLPAELRHVQDFRTVAAVGRNVWLAGAPGSVVWHSPDAGQTWQSQATGNATPINSLNFSSPTQGVAVGDMGLILATNDAGQSWHTLRGGGRSAAFATFQARPAKLSPGLYAKYSAEQGYRGVTWMATDSSAGLKLPSPDLEDRLAAAVVESGGSSSSIAWQFPVQIPGSDLDTKLLVREWQTRTEGRLSETLMSTLVRELRMWRPRVVILDQPGSDDAVVSLLQDAVRQAIRDAANPDRYLSLQELTKLSPWQVERVYVRVADGSSGNAEIDPYEFLFHSGATVDQASSSARQRLGLPTVRTQAHEAYRLLSDSATPDQAGQDLFAGLDIAPGTAARRSSPQLHVRDEAKLARRQDAAKRQRQFAGIAEKTFDDPQAAAQILAQLQDLVGSLPAEQGASTLAIAWDEHRRHARYDLAETVAMEMLRRYPQEPVTREAMTWMISLWTSSELAWQRGRPKRGPENNIIDTAGTFSNRIQQVSGIAGSDNRGPVADNDFRNPRQPLKTTGDATIDRRHQQATELAKLLELQAPIIFERPEIQFPLAALYRASGDAGKSDQVYRNFGRAMPDDPWRQVATRELWLVQPQTVPPPQLARVTVAVQPPYLDGLLSDPCWQSAREIRLTDARTPSPTARELLPGELPEGEQRATGADHGFVLLAYNSQYLFLAASLPQSADLAHISPAMKDRRYDADLSRCDRISLCLDLDRDYATAYELQIDQRGWTGDRCWEDASWNPRWFVGVDADKERWRVEAAIPWEELTPKPPGRGAAWAAAITRTIPGARVESWVTPSEENPTAASFGVLRFE